MFSSIPDPYPLGASMTIKMCSDSATCLPEGRIAPEDQCIIDSRSDFTRTVLTYGNINSNIATF